MYQPSGNYDVLLGLGIHSSVSEALDKFLQEGFVEELSSSIIESFTKLNEENAMKCIQMMRDQCKDNNLSPEALNDLVVQFVPTEEVAVAEVEPQAETEDVAVAEIEPEAAPAPDPVVAPNTVPEPETESAAETSVTKWDFGQFNPRKLEPDAAKLKEILDRTGYSHEINQNGLRRYGGPPPGMSEEKPGNGTEVFIGKVPQDIYEDSIIPMFESIGKLWEVRVLTNKAGQNRGFGFVTYCDRKDAKKACDTFDGMEVRPKKKIVVKLSVQFTRLHVTGVPKDKNKEDIKTALSEFIENIADVSIPISERAAEKNRGFCFLDFNNYFEAAAARNKWLRKTLTVPSWNNATIAIDWAIPNDNPDEEAAEKSTAILITGFSKKEHPEVTDAALKEVFSKYGEISSVRRKDKNAKINFFQHDHAIAAIAGENGKEIHGAKMQIELHVPLTEYALRMKAMQQKPGYRKRRGGGGGGGIGGMDARTLLNKRIGPKPNFDVRSQLSSVNLRRLGGVNSASYDDFSPFTVYNDPMGSYEDIMYDDPYVYEDPRAFDQPIMARGLKREQGLFQRPGPSTLPLARQLPLRSAPLPQRSTFSAMYREQEFSPVYAARPLAAHSSYYDDPYYDEVPVAKVPRMLPAQRTVDPYARVSPPGIKRIAAASGITKQALNAGAAEFSTTNSMPLGGRPMRRIVPGNAPSPSLVRYGPPPTQARAFPARAVAPRMPMRGMRGGLLGAPQKRSLSQIAPPMQSSYNHTGASFTKF